MLAGDRPDTAAEQIMRALSGPVLSPAPEILVDSLPRGQIMGQQAPGTTTAYDMYDIEDAVQNLPLGVFLGPATRFGCGY